MRGWRGVVAAILFVVGLVWIGQGFGVIPGSFMTSDLRWAMAGAGLVIAAGVLVWSGRRR